MYLRESDSERVITTDKNALKEIKPILLHMTFIQSHRNNRSMKTLYF
jgi:hypothetical protein